MLSESALGAYFWGVYIWFVIGFLLIAVPAIREIAMILAGLKNKQNQTTGIEGDAK